MLHSSVECGTYKRSALSVTGLALGVLRIVE